MDKLPNELFEQIISNLDVADLRNCRLVNSLWHTLVTEHFRRFFVVQFTIKNQNQLIQFNRLIPPGAFLPTQRFKFCHEAISTRSSTLHIQEFASKYGHSINGLLFALKPVPAKELRKGDYVKSNITILLSSVSSSLEVLSIHCSCAVGQIDDLPSVFPKLSEIYIDYGYPPAFTRRGDPYVSLLDQIVSRVPQIKIFDLVNYPGGDWYFFRNLPIILGKLNEMNEDVKVTLGFNPIPFDPYNATSWGPYFSKLLGSPSPKIVGLALRIPERYDRETSTTVTRGIKEWIQLHANHLRVLKLTEIEESMVVAEFTPFEDLVLDLPCLISLEELNIQCINHRKANETTDYRILPKQLPKLRILRMGPNLVNMFNGVFPNVTELEFKYSFPDRARCTNFETKLESTFPNVKVLIIDSLEMAFKFFGLRTLIIRIWIWEGVDYWDILTGGAPRVPETEICTVEWLEQPGINLHGNRVESKIFSVIKDLPHLDRLTFKLNRPNLDFVAALIYLSKAKKLRRLHELVLHYPENHPIPVGFQEELRRHHDEFKVISGSR